MEKKSHLLPSLSPHSLVTHPPRAILPEGNWPLVDPVYHSTKFTYDTLESLQESFQGHQEGYFYSRRSNPTVRQLEKLLAQLQGQEEGLAVGSGVAALSVCLLGHLKTGDHVIMFLESYKPTRYLVRQLLGKFGVQSSVVSLQDLKYGEREVMNLPIIPGQTKMILLESPTNPMTMAPDLGKITATARSQGILTLLDNTFAGLHHHGQYPIDLYVHSLTKFSSGHGDVLGGVILGRDILLRPLRDVATELGPSLDPHAAYLILRGMKTYFLRYERQQQNAHYLAMQLQHHPGLQGLLYPGLHSHPHYDLHQRQMKGEGGNIITMTLQGPSTRLSLFISSLSLTTLAASMGSTETMVAPCDLLFAGDLTPEQKEKAGIHPNTLRISVGIEDKEDILKDLLQAFKAIEGPDYDRNEKNEEN